MIRPQDLPPTAVRTAVCLDIEAHIDEHLLSHAYKGGAWPLVIGVTRSGWSDADVKAVLSDYRANGWDVMSGGRRALCVIRPSIPGTIENRRDEELAAALETYRG